MPTLIAWRDRALPRVASVWRWWIAELAGLWPSRLPLPFAGAAPAADVRPYRDRVEIIRVGRDEGERLVDDAPIDRFDDTNWTEIARLVADHRARVILAPPLVHVLNLTLPKVARARLASAIPLQLRDHAPLRPELLDWAVLAVEPLDEQRIRVAVVIVRRALLDTIAAGFAGQETAVPAILAEIDDRTCVLRRPSGRGTALPTLSRPWLIAFAILRATPVLSLILLSILCATEASTVSDLEPIVRPKLAAEQRLRDKALVGRTLNALVEMPTVTAIVEDLAARLPATASARQVAVDPSGGVTFALDETDPAAIATVLARDPVLPEIRQVGDPRKVEDHVELDYAATIR